jgi:hypothetical protein
MFKEQIVSIFQNFFQKVTEEGKCQLIHYVNITEIPKQDKNITRLIALIDINTKILNKILAIQIQQQRKGIIYHD